MLSRFTSKLQTTVQTILYIKYQSNVDNKRKEESVFKGVAHFCSFTIALVFHDNDTLEMFSYIIIMYNINVNIPCNQTVI